MRRYERPNRRPTRSRQHAYDLPGAYFVTICTHACDPHLGEIVDGDVVLSQLGQIIASCWRQLPQRFRAVGLDGFTVMPNHVHGIIVLSDASPALMPALSTVVGAFKTESARRINTVRGSRGVPVWQRSFHDQIIRDDRHLENVRAYIATNPANWHADEDNPAIAIKGDQ